MVAKLVIQINNIINAGNRTDFKLREITYNILVF